jgi:predicted alpha/beta superfamily hydrolase
MTTGSQTDAGIIPAPPGCASQLRLHEFRSKIFNNQRMLRVWLPPGYEDPVNRTKRYPVLYLNDGQNLFDASTSFTGIAWQAGETAGRLVRSKKIPSLIIVGVDNAQDQRIGEYSPYCTSMLPTRKAQGKRYPDFLLNEVAPFIRKRYRIASGQENTGLGGSSLGATISLYIVMARPNLFGRVLLESPALAFCQHELLRDARNSRNWPQRIFMAVGSQETGDQERSQEVVDSVHRLAKILRWNGLGPQRLKICVDEGATHSESAWARRLPAALEFLYEKSPIEF